MSTTTDLDLSRTTAADTAAARRVPSVIVRAETDGSLAPDARRVLRAEADTLRAAIETERHDHPRHHGSRPALAAAVAEARRVAAMWGVRI